MHARQEATVRRARGLAHALFAIATVDLLGWAITGAVLFAGAAWALGSRTLVRDVLVAAYLGTGPVAESRPQKYFGSVND